MWPRYSYGCLRCTLRWTWIASVCPGCGHNEIRVDTETMRKAS
jgi:ribosomal protein L40E